MKTILVDAVDTFDIEGPNGFYIFSEMQALLDSYPNEKILVTGANDEQFIEWGLNHMPYEVFTLKHNPEKADPAFYKALLAHYDLTPDDVIYFEHAPQAVQSAQSVGIQT